MFEMYVMRLFLLIVLGGLSLIACSPKEETTALLAPVVHKGTPYPFTYPSYFPRPFDSLAVHSLTVEGVALGRHLFYEKMLSVDTTVSCGSCHVQSHAFSDPARFSSGVSGRSTARNSMSLANMAWVDNYFWDGRAKTLREQVLFPIQDFHEMNLSLNEMVRRLNQSALYRTMFAAAFGNEEATAAAVADALAQFVQQW